MISTVLDFKWHVVYTRPKSERKVAESIADLGLEFYLPLQEVVRQWSDRRKRMEVPLFPNYVFVKTDEVRRLSLFAIKELVNFVSIEKKPVVIREKEIVTIKRLLSKGAEIAPEEYFQVGSEVKIMKGQFAGLEGIVIRKSGKMRLMIRITAIMRAFSVNLPVDAVESLSNHFEPMHLS